MHLEVSSISTIRRSTRQMQATGHISGLGQAERAQHFPAATLSKDFPSHLASIQEPFYALAAVPQQLCIGDSQQGGKQFAPVVCRSSTVWYLQGTMLIWASKI